MVSPTTIMHVIFDPDQVDWSQFIVVDNAQSGGGYASRFQLGRGFFEGMPYQRGHGLGTVFRSLWRFLLPLGKQAAVSVGREGLEATSRVLNTMLDANNSASVGETLRREAATGASNLLNRASHRLRQSGRGGRCPKTYKPLRTRVGPVSPPANRKKTRRDILGVY